MRLPDDNAGSLARGTLGIAQPRRRSLAAMRDAEGLTTLGAIGAMNPTHDGSMNPYFTWGVHAWNGAAVWGP